MKDAGDRLSLDRPVKYEVRVPGRIDDSWSDWFEGLTITVESGAHGPTISTLTIVADQAALQGFLGRLYGLGLPLLSVKCLDADQSQEGTHRKRE
jgi:hypothetical protein